MANTQPINEEIINECRYDSRNMCEICEEQRATTTLGYSIYKMHVCKDCFENKADYGK